MYARGVYGGEYRAVYGNDRVVVALIRGLELSLSCSILLPSDTADTAVVKFGAN